MMNPCMQAAVVNVHTLRYYKAGS